MSQQQPDYVRLNPNMTLPTLAGPGVVLDRSGDIAEFVFAQSDGSLDTETRVWLDLDRERRTRAPGALRGIP
jgi:ganglioside-induced differentiation-associated protein 1